MRGHSQIFFLLVYMLPFSKLFSNKDGRDKDGFECRCQGAWAHALGALFGITLLVSVLLWISVQKELFEVCSKGRKRTHLVTFYLMNELFNKAALEVVKLIEGIGIAAILVCAYKPLIADWVCVCPCGCDVFPLLWMNAPSNLHASIPWLK